jgi:hypothetical protein
MWPKWIRAAIGSWVMVDSHRRGGLSYFWSCIVLFFGPLLLPFYLAARPLVSGETRRGGFFWNVFWHFETLASLIMGLLAVGVTIENMIESRRKELALVKKAEMKAGTILGCLATLALYGISRLVVGTVRRSLESENG